MMSFTTCHFCQTPTFVPEVACAACHRILPPFECDIFVTFHMPLAVEIDRKAMDQVYFSYQRLLHPDKMVNREETEQNFAIQHLGRINNAYKDLQSVLKRLRFLYTALTRQKIPDSPPSMDFLQKVLAMQENPGHNSAVITIEKQNLMEKIKKSLSDQNYDELLSCIGQLTYLDKF